MITVFVLDWLLPHLEHLIKVAGYTGHCHYEALQHVRVPDGPGHLFKIGRVVCGVWDTTGRMHPQ